MRRLFRQFAHPAYLAALGVLLTISLIGYLCAENVVSSGVRVFGPTIERLPLVEPMVSVPVSPPYGNQIPYGNQGAYGYQGAYSYQGYGSVPVGGAAQIPYPNQGGPPVTRTPALPYSSFPPIPPTVPLLAGPTVTAPSQATSMSVLPLPESDASAKSEAGEKGKGEEAKPDDRADEVSSEKFLEGKSTGPLGLITVDEQYAWVNEVRPDSLLVRTTRYLSQYVGEWEGSVQLGLDGTSGSSETFNVAFGVNGKRQLDVANFNFDLDYKRSNSDGIITADRLFFTCRYEHPYRNGLWNFFIQDEVTYDEFQPWNAQVALSSGIGYYFLKNEMTQLQGLWGGGFSQEIGGPDEECVPEIHFGLTGEHQINKRQKLIGSSHYYPDASDFNKSRIVNKLSWEVLLDEEVNLSMKVNITDRLYCPNPGGEENDLNYSMLLMWKF